MKTCTSCGKPKPLDRFAKRGASDDRLRAHCKDCTNHYMSEYKKGYTLSADPVDATPTDKTNVAQPNRTNIWALPVYVEKPWGR